MTTTPGAAGPSGDVGVDVVIAVHTPERPIARAVRSVVEHNGEGVRLTVVCHGVAAEVIVAEIDPRHRDRVRLLEHHDGRRSPAGPFNAGIDAADAQYVAVMGSDDELAPGAVSSWYWAARKAGADAVVARLEHADRRVVPTPPTRPWRRRDLDLVKDRLSYRSAPLGLVARAAVERLGLRMDEKVDVGEDVGFVTRLWAQGSVTFDRTGPPYRIGADAAGRVTHVQRPVEAELAFVRRLLGRRWFQALPLDQRRAVCVKVTRIHLFGVVLNRPDPAWWTPAELGHLADVARKLRDAAPGAQAVLSLADRALLDLVERADGPPERLLALARARRRHGTPATLLTRDPVQLLAREAPLRMMAASVLVR